MAPQCCSALGTTCPAGCARSGTAPEEPTPHACSCVVRCWRVDHSAFIQGSLEKDAIQVVGTSGNKVKHRLLTAVGAYLKDGGKGKKEIRLALGERTSDAKKGVSFSQATSRRGGLAGRMGTWSILGGDEGKRRMREGAGRERRGGKGGANMKLCSDRGSAGMHAHELHVG